LDFFFDTPNGLRGCDIEGDGFASQRLEEDLVLRIDSTFSGSLNMKHEIKNVNEKFNSIAIATARSDQRNNLSSHKDGESSFHANIPKSNESSRAVA
jgi:hypothetical protein